MRKNNRFGYVSADVSEQFCGYYAHLITDEDADEVLVPHRNREEAEECVEAFLRQEELLENQLVIQP